MKEKHVSKAVLDFVSVKLTTCMLKRPDPRAMPLSVRFPPSVQIFKRCKTKRRSKQIFAGAHGGSSRVY
jgi:hypothetical protein